MSRRKYNPGIRDDYFHMTLREFYSLIFVAPLLAFFHLYAVGSGGLYAPHDVGTILGYFGGTATFLPPLAVGAVLLAQHALHGYSWEIKPSVLAGMVGESILLAAPLVVMSLLTGQAMSQAAADSPPSQFMQAILRAVGAGVYEEFIFRLFFIGIVMLVFVDLLNVRHKDTVAIVAMLAGAVLFSLYHFTGGEPFVWGDFVFRATAGALLGGVFLVRGFGIAVGAHIVYNLFIVLSRGA